MLPKHLPGSQSFFYMRIITLSYYQAKHLLNSEEVVPSEIIQSCDQLLCLSCITQAILYSIVHSLTLYLMKEDNLILLTKYYEQDNKPTLHCIGHIHANNQEKILEESALILDDDEYKKNKLHNFYDGKKISVKEAIDFFIWTTYHLDFQCI